MTITHPLAPNAVERIMSRWYGVQRMLEMTEHVVLAGKSFIQVILFSFVHLRLLLENDTVDIGVSLDRVAAYGKPHVTVKYNSTSRLIHETDISTFMEAMLNDTFDIISILEVRRILYLVSFVYE